MSIYIVLLISLLIIGVYSSLSQKNTFFAVYFLLLVVAFFRDISVGSDFMMYEQGFRNYGYLGRTSERLEPAWYFIYPFFYKIADFRTYVFFFYAALYFFLLEFVWRESKYPVIAILFYVLLGHYFESFNIMRQIFAALFVLYSVSYIEKRNLVKFLALIFAGTLFHTSVILFLPMYFVSHWIRDYKKLMVMLLLVTLFIGYYGIVSIFSHLPMGLSQFAKYEMYLTMVRDNISFMGLLINGVNTILAILFLFIVKDKNTKYYVLMYVIGVCLNNLLFEYQWFFRVYNPLFLIFIIIVIPNIFFDIKPKYLKLTFISFLFLYGIGIFYSLLKNNASGVVPYKLFF